MNQRPTFLLDGEEVPFEPGQTVLQAALCADRYIPHLCYHPEFTPHGSCKVCTAKVNGRMMAACTTPAESATDVESNTEELNELRRTLVQMLFAEGNHFCPSCEKSGNCVLQALGYDLGVMTAGFRHLFPDRPVDASHPEIVAQRLQHAVATLLAGRAEVVALGEQHLHQRAAQLVQFLGVALDLGGALGRRGAGGHHPAVHLGGADLAAPVRLEFRVVAQVGDVLAGGQRRLHHGLAGLERHFDAVEEEARTFVHGWASRCAAASSRPVICRARSSAPSRSKAGAKSSERSLRS